MSNQQQRTVRVVLMMLVAFALLLTLGLWQHAFDDPAAIVIFGITFLMMLGIGYGVLRMQKKAEGEGGQAEVKRRTGRLFGWLFAVATILRLLSYLMERLAS